MNEKEPISWRCENKSRRRFKRTRIWIPRWVEKKTFEGQKFAAKRRLLHIIEEKDTFLFIQSTQEDVEFTIQFWVSSLVVEKKEKPTEAFSSTINFTAVGSSSVRLIFVGFSASGLRNSLSFGFGVALQKLLITDRSLLGREMRCFVFNLPRRIDGEKNLNRERRRFVRVKKSTHS